MTITINSTLSAIHAAILLFCARAILMARQTAFGTPPREPAMIVTEHAGRRNTLNPAKVLRTLSGAMCVSCLVAGMLRPLQAFGAETSASPVRSAAEIDYPPFSIVHEDGRVDGFSVELMRAVLQKMGREVTFQTGPWSEVRGRLERGEVDALPLVGRTPEREHIFDFTVPYMTMRGAIVVRDEMSDVRNLADLRGRRVGVMKSDNAEEFLRREKQNFEIVTTSTFADAFYELAAGRLDAVVVQRLVAMRLLEETGLKNLMIVENPVAGFSQDFCFAVKDGDREMLSILNEGLALAVADGSHRRLHAKWFAHLELPTDRPIIVGGDHNYPPFEFLDNKGRPAGFTVDLTRAIAREMNMEARIQLGPWEDMIDALRNGKIDAMEGMFYSADRDRELDFSPRYMIIHCVGIVRKGEGPPPETLEELHGRDLVVQAGDAILETLAERGVKARITTVETQEDVVRAVVEGRNDCGLMTRFGALHAISKNGWKNVDIGDTAIYSGQYAYAVPQGNEALLAQFTEGLQILKDSGEYQRIYEKWLGVYEPSIPSSTVLKYIAFISAPLLLIFMLILLWSWSLRKQVSSRTSELRESLDRFQFVFEAANVGKSITLPTGEVNANKAFADMLGYTVLELKGKTWQDLTPPEDIPDTESRIASLIDGRENNIRFEKRYIRKDGGFVLADVSSTVRRDSHNRPIHFITTVIDITERKQAENALSESESKFRHIYENMSIGIAKVSLEFRIEQANQAYCLMLGYTEEELIGKHLKDITNVEILAENLRLQSQLARGEIDSYRMEKRFIHKNGHDVYGILVANLIRDAEGNPAYFLGSVLDISEQKQLERDIEKERLQYIALMESSTDHIFMLDRDGYYIASNDNVEHMGAVSGKEIVGANMRDYKDSETLRIYESALDTIWNTGKSISFEHGLTDSAGTSRHHIDTLYPVNTDGEIWAVGGICKDITELKKWKRSFSCLKK
jgi:PAS domain S-box-containing protein